MHSSVHNILGKMAFLLSVVLFSALIIFAMLNRQTNYIYLGIAVIALPMFFLQKDSAVFKAASTLTLVSALMLFSTFLGSALPSMQLFYIGVLIVMFLVPVLFTNTKLMTYCYVAVLLFFTGTSYGMFERQEFSDVYTRGDGQLYISLFNIYLVLVALSILIHERLEKREQAAVPVKCNLYKYFWLFNVIFLVYILIGVGYGVPFTDIIDYSGVINLTNMSLLVFVLIKSFKTETEVEPFMKFFLVCMVTRGLFGIYRFFFLRGDPSNPYRNYLHEMDANITFFDWNDGLIACIAVFYALWILMKTDNVLSKNWQKLYWLVVIVGMFNMAFSYRRTVWGGLILAMLWFIQYLNVKQRIKFGVIAVVIVSVIFSYLVANRLGEKEGGILQSIMPDIYTEKSEEVSFDEGSRFFELKLVWETVKKNILFGVGPWGVFEAKVRTGYAQSNTTHSSLMFMLLKMGVVGLISYLLILFAYVSFWLKARKREWNDIALRAFGEAGFAGFVFCIPSFVFAPMINEYRTMSVFGLCLALPYIAYHFDKKQLALINQSEH